MKRKWGKKGRCNTKIIMIIIQGCKWGKIRHVTLKNLFICELGNNCMLYTLFCYV